MNIENLVIRSAVESDIAKIVALAANDVTGREPNNPATDFPSTFRCPTAKIIIADYEGEIAGTLTASWNGRNGELRYFWVAPRLRRTRAMEQIFENLLEEAVMYLRSTGMRRVLFFVRRDADSRKQIRMYNRKFNAEVVDPIVMAFSLENQ